MKERGLTTPPCLTLACPQTSLTLKILIGGLRSLTPFSDTVIGVNQ